MRPFQRARARRQLLGLRFTVADPIYPWSNSRSVKHLSFLGFRGVPFARTCPAGGLALSLLLGLPAISTTAAQGGPALQLGWTNNMLSVSRADLPGGPIQIWYLEAFCRSGSTHRPWDQTTLPHKMERTDAQANGQHLKLHTTIGSSVTAVHEIDADSDEVTFNVTLQNTGAEVVDVDWFQPCLRVDRFTGRSQSNYISRCFIFTETGLTTLDKTHRTDDALYRGGQVYVPTGVNLDDVNPRPISPDRPVNDLIGCFSSDGRWILATAWDRTQELFQGVIVCIHNDPRVGGLKPGETKHLRGKLYLVPNDPAALLRRYETDFPGH